MSLIEKPSSKYTTSPERSGDSTPAKHKEEPYMKKTGDGAFTTPSKMNIKNMAAIPEEEHDFTKTNE